jgi:hypothetical protein
MQRKGLEEDIQFERAAIKDAEPVVTKILKGPARGARP